MPADTLTAYRAKRDFDRTPEPRGKRGTAGKTLGFVVQKHAASRLHFDLRLEVDGVYKSWAVPKGPSLDPAEKRLAVQVEDHPLDYGSFEGTIPEGAYGAGTVQLWDRGSFRPEENDPAAAIKRGKLTFALDGERLQGGWKLVRMGGKARDKGQNWLLMKIADAAARIGEEAEIATEDSSVASRRTMAEITAGKKAAPPPKATKAAPGFIAPQLARTEQRPPQGAHWVHEIKFDGYRVQFRAAEQVATGWSRSGQDWTDRFGSVARAVAKLPDCTLDGEIVALNDAGQPDFAALQDALSRGDDDEFTYFVFDLLAEGGVDRRALPLSERKARLAKLMARKPDPRLRYVEHFESPGDAVWKSACRMALEGIVSKRGDAPYSSGRGETWIKTKCRGRDEFVVGGFSAGKNDTGGIGALLVGVFDGKTLRYRGRVGTGFGGAVAQRLRKALKPLARKATPFDSVQPAKKSDVLWVEPRLVAEVEYGGWTGDGLLRHAAFKGLREDKPSREVVAEETAPPRASPKSPGPQAAKSTAPGAGAFAISNPDKALWPEDGFTKRDLADYYARMATHVLRFIGGRPLSLIRAPDGIARQLFFQRHAMKGMSAAITEVAIAGQDKPYLVVRDVAGLAGLAQIAAVELHPWAAKADDVERPDYLSFDLDPDPDLAFAMLKQAAIELRERLEKLGLPSFPKLTGGKGVHVVVPLKPRANWDEAKGFAHAIAIAMEREAPDRFTSVMSKKRRTGRIFVDYLRNGRTATAIACWSPRARGGAPISVPLGWSALAKATELPRFSIRDTDAALKLAKAWDDFDDARTPLSAALVKRFAA